MSKIEHWCSKPRHTGFCFACDKETHVEFCELGYRAKVGDPAPCLNMDCDSCEACIEYWTKKTYAQMIEKEQRKKDVSDPPWSPPAPRPDTPKQIVYFLLCEGSGLVKIGYTDCLPRRLQTLQSGSGATQKLLKSIPGGLNREKALHKRFSSLRMHGEWFRCEADLAKELEA